MSQLPSDLDPREFALQLAVVAGRLDERSTRAVEHLERTSAEFRREVTAAASMLGAERRRAAAAQAAAGVSGYRHLWIASAALLFGALVAVAGATLALSSARREIDAMGRDLVLLEAVNAADLTLCGERLCARVERPQGRDDDRGYQAVALRRGTSP
ncbi:hypothetical protein [Luteimonas sp. MC1825]|uniref:hypothetical protein n=1 Tax=Luteimonas sp. MC1825 TaxID=2761107 RepID=UPI001615604C|nr:hypothetical protein [Luteimonas sp. MC1825]MBB6600013.1 hypothetical protein [Luteimonas sp. MC1825]QOC87716.1 hypothetical protein IDM46_10800 [Luteimonas sp. MC1825]